MRTAHPTEQDYERGYLPCLECADYVAPLEAGTELDFVTCKQCGSVVAKRSDYA